MTTHMPTANDLPMGPRALISWWPSAARHLDEMDERLATELSGRTLKQALHHEPRLFSRMRRLTKQRNLLRKRIARLRASVSRRSTERGAAVELATEFDELVRDEQRHAQSVRLVVWDAYTTDIGTAG